MAASGAAGGRPLGEEVQVRGVERRSGGLAVHLLPHLPDAAGIQDGKARTRKTRAGKTRKPRRHEGASSRGPPSVVVILLVPPMRCLLPLVRDGEHLPGGAPRSHEVEHPVRRVQQRVVRVVLTAPCSSGVAAAMLMIREPAGKAAARAAASCSGTMLRAASG